MKKKLRPGEVCDFLGINMVVYEMIFGFANGMKTQDIPTMIVENMANLIEITKMDSPKRKRRGTIKTVSGSPSSDNEMLKKEELYNICLNDLNLLFTKHDICIFWSFINFITHSTDLAWARKQLLAEANLIAIANKYQRPDIERFERIWWYLTNMFARILGGRQAIDHDPEWIATIILTGEKYFFDRINMIKEYKWNKSSVPDKVVGFEKIFFKYERVPAMFWDTTLYPVFPRNKVVAKKK